MYSACRRFVCDSIAIRGWYGETSAENGEKEGKRRFPCRGRNGGETARDLSRRVARSPRRQVVRQRESIGQGIKYPEVPGTYRAENYK